MTKKLILLFLLLGLTLITHSQERNLEFYISEGIRNSPLLSDYRNQVNSAIADSLLIRAAKRPLIEAKSQLQYSPVYYLSNLTSLVV